MANGSLPWQRQPGILWRALEQCGIDKKTVRLGGPPVENVAIDEEGGRTIARLGAFSGLLGIALAYWSLRSVKLTAIVFVCGILSAAAGLSVVYWSGFKMDAVLMSMPSLLYVLAISGSVHLINYYREAIRKYGLEGAPETAIRYGWKPALLCSVTTAVGLAAVIRVWQVFPFDLTSGWEVVFRIFLVIAVVGSLIGIVAAISRFVTSVGRPEPPR